MTPFYPLMIILFTAALMLPQVTAITNSTFIPRPAFGDGHHPGRQLGWADHFKDFQISETDMVNISGQRYQIGDFIKKGCWSCIQIYVRR